MGAGRVVAALTRTPVRGGIVGVMSVAFARPIWCTTCGEYVRPGTHGIHPMRPGGGAEPLPDEPPEASALAVVLTIVLVIAGAGVLLVAWAALILRMT